MAIIGIIVGAVLIAGCTACLPSKTPGASDPILQNIDAALEKGPVFVEFGAPWCHWCDEEKPIVEELSKEYPGVTFININVDENGSLADAFYVGGIPQMDVIVKKAADGSYLYADIDGNTTGDRKKSAIIGYTKKAVLKKALDAAMRARG